MSQPELAFLHIPKTAGTSQHQLFNRLYGRDNVFWFGNDCPGNIQVFPQKLVADSALIGGHKPVSFYPQRYDPLYCAVVRNPLERAISLFAYYARPNLARSPSEREERQKMLENMLIQGIDPDSMLNSLRKSKSFRRLISNMQCAYLSRYTASFEGVIKSLSSDDFIIGTLENYGKFHLAISDLLNWPREVPAVLNRGQDNYAREFLADAELTAYIAELNTEDYKLYDFLLAEHDGLLMNIRNQEKRQRRLDRLPLRGKSGAEPIPMWVQTGRQFWSSNSDNSLSWPYNNRLFLAQYKLLYAPIPSLVNRRILTVLFNQSQVEHKNAVRKLGLLRTIDRFNTGLALKDMPIAEAESVLNDSSYYRFAVLTEPLQRLLDQYLEYFGRKRNKAVPISQTLAASVAGHQGQETPDLVTGITFRQFVDYIVEQDIDKQEPAAKPQYLFIPDNDKFHKVYRDNQLSELQQDWREFCAMPTAVSNATPAAAGSPLGGNTPGEARSDRMLADSLPPDFPGDAVLKPSDFADDQIRHCVERYYRRDYQLYNATFEENGIKVFDDIR